MNIRKTISIALMLALGLTLGIGGAVHAKANASQIDLGSLSWSVQYLIDQSQTVLGNSQITAPRDNRGLAISPDGQYLYAGYNNGPEVRKIDLTQADYTTATVARTTVSRGKAIAVDDQGRVYLAEGASIKILDANLSAVQFTISTTKCEGVAVQREGGTLALYATERGGPNTLTRWALTESGGVITDASPAGLDGDGVITITGASDMRGVAVDSSGRIWIADPSSTIGNGKVFRVDSDGTGLVSNTDVPNPYAIAFNGDEVLVTGGYQRIISVLDIDDLSLVDTLIPPWSSMELDPDGGDGQGSLMGIVVTPDGFYVTNEAGQTADEKSTYGVDDGYSGDVSGKHYTDLSNDDNDPILFATNPPSVSPNADATIHVHTGDAPGMGRSGYRVNVYHAGGAYISYQNTDSSGDVTFHLDNGDYEYEVTRWGAVGERQAFTVAGVDQTLSYRLSTVTVKVFADYPANDTGYAGYRVNLYLADETYMLYGNTDGDGHAEFFVPVPAGDNQFKFDVSRWGAVSEKQTVDVDFGSDTDASYRLSTIKVTVFADYPLSGTGYAGYRVNLYLADETYMLYNNTDSNGDVRFFVPVPAGDNQFRFDVSRWGAVSTKQTVDVDFGADTDASYRLSTITVNVFADYPSANTGYAGYRVNLYLADDTYMLYSNTDSNGDVRFFVPVPAGDNQFKFDVSRWGAVGTKQAVDVDEGLDRSETYRLSTVTIHAYQGNSLPGTAIVGARVNLYLANDAYMLYNNTDSSGNARFFLPVPAGTEQFKYQVTKGCHVSAKVPFTVNYGFDQLINHKLTATVSIHITDGDGGDHAGYRVYMYLPGAGSHFAYQDSDLNGMTTFELDALADYEYLVSYGRSSQRVAFSTCSNETLDYELAKVEITPDGLGYASYRVYVYNNGSGSHFTYKDLNAGETATFYLVDGDYQYLVSYGHSSQRVDFTIPRDLTNAPEVVTAENLSLTYNLAQVDITVAGAGSASYRVYVYNNGSGSHFTYKDLNAGETATFYLVDGDYQYLVSYGHSSQRVDFTIPRDLTNAPEVVTAEDSP